MKSVSFIYIHLSDDFQFQSDKLDELKTQYPDCFFSDIDNQSEQLLLNYLSRLVTESSYSFVIIDVQKFEKVNPALLRLLYNFSKQQNLYVFQLFENTQIQAVFKRIQSRYFFSNEWTEIQQTITETYQTIHSS